MSTVTPAPSTAQQGSRTWLARTVWLGVLIVGCTVGIWLGQTNRLRLPGVATVAPDDREVVKEGHAHDHGRDHEHGHAGHDEASSIELSPEAQRNIGLQTGSLEFGEFERTVSLPAMIVERRGQSRMEVAAPLTGVITRIDVTLGQAIVAGQPLFELRLTHEELVQGQGDYLRTLEELDVVDRELARLRSVEAEGAIAGKVVLEREYERQKLAAVLLAQQQALLLHGLSPEQIAAIERNRELLGAMTVVAPAAPHQSVEGNSAGCLLQVQDLLVELGKHVTAGDALCELADHCELLVEGQAFEQDARLLNEAIRQGWNVRAVVELGGGQEETIEGLKILLLGNRVNPESRTLPVQAVLPNELVRDDVLPGDRRVIGWRFKPGQRVRLDVPVETWTERLVLPAEAVVQEGPESYVFVQNGDHFDRRPVHVEYRDERGVVLADGNDKVWPGDTVALTGAAQLQLALKNKAGGGVDPHAGHNH